MPLIHTSQHFCALRLHTQILLRRKKKKHIHTSQFSLSLVCRPESERESTTTPRQIQRRRFLRAHLQATRERETTALMLPSNLRIYTEFKKKIFPNRWGNDRKRCALLKIKALAAAGKTLYNCSYKTHKHTDTNIDKPNRITHFFCSATSAILIYCWGLLSKIEARRHV